MERIKSAAEMLDELMGDNRDGAKKAREGLTFDSSEVCRYYLVDICLRDAFYSIKVANCPFSVKRSCQKYHCNELKAQFEADKCDASMKKRFIGIYLNDCSRILAGVEDKTIQSKRNQLMEITTRLRDNGIGPTEQSEIEDSLAEYHKRIMQLLRDAETEVGQDNLTKAKELFNCACNIENQRKLLKYKMFGSLNLNDICKLCGGNYGRMLDRARAEQEHTNGKFHVAVSRIKTSVEKLKKAQRKEVHKRLKPSVSSRRKDIVTLSLSDEER